MAGPVKGQFGAEEITLEDAATETTLLKMLSVLQSQNKSKSGGGAASSEKDLMSLAKATGKTTKELEDFEDQIEEISVNTIKYHQIATNSNK